MLLVSPPKPIVRWVLEGSFSCVYHSYGMMSVVLWKAVSIISFTHVRSSEVRVKAFPANSTIVKSMAISNPSLVIIDFIVF